MASVILNVVACLSYCDYDDISKILILVDCFYYANSHCVIYVGNQKLCAQKMCKIFCFSTRTSPGNYTDDLLETFDILSNTK